MFIENLLLILYPCVYIVSRDTNNYGSHISLYFLAIYAIYDEHEFVVKAFKELPKKL